MNGFTAPPLDSPPRSNPFASRRVRPGAIPFEFPRGLDAAKLVARFAELGCHAAIVGPHGAGKSTLLASLLPELERRGCMLLSIALHDGQRRLPGDFLAPLSAIRMPVGRRDGSTYVPKAIVVVDGYEQLSLWNRWRLRRRCRSASAGLLLTAHRPTTLPTLFHTAADFDLAVRIVDRLSAAAGNPEGSDSVVGMIGRDALHGIWLRHRGNFRETLFELYDIFERKRIALSNASGATR